MTNKKNGQISRLLFGMIFYFMEDPGGMKRVLCDIFEEFLREPFFNAFHRITEDGERYRSFRKPAWQYIESAIKNHDFERSLYFCLTDATPTTVHSTRIEFLGRRLHDQYLGKSPNYIYIELPAVLDSDLLWNLFIRPWSSFPFILGYGNSVIAPHEELMPRSGSEAAKLVRTSDAFVTSSFATWRNPDYRLKIPAGSSCIEGTNQFIGLGQQIHESLSQSKAFEAAGLGGQNCLFIPADSYWLFRADTDDQRRELSKFLAPLFCELSKPVKFWKTDEWKAWRNKMTGR